MEYLTDITVFSNMERNLNYTDIRIENYGNYFKCHKCPVSKVGANLLLDCIEIDYGGNSGLLYGGFQDMFTSVTNSGPITHLCEEFVIIISLPQDDYSNTKLDKYASIKQQFNKRCLFKIDIDGFRECFKKSDIKNVYFPDATKPVLFNKLLYEDVYLMRYEYECALEDINQLLKNKHWNFARKSKCIDDIRLLQEFECYRILKSSFS